MRPYHVAETYDPMAQRLFPYEQIAAHVAARLRGLRPDLATILDVACGTGNLTLPLARLGFQVTGLDLSPEMLARARHKAAAEGLDVPFLCQDMREPYPVQPVDAVTCFYGGLNFLNSPDALRQMFAAVHAALRPGGLFAFEQFAEAKLRAAFGGAQAGDYGDFFVATRSRVADDGQIRHDVTFFLRQPDGHYHREDEQHHLRIHPHEELRQLLTESGFRLRLVEEIYPHVEARTLQDVFLFVAQKAELETSEPAN